jgi:hypothetical protein
MPEPDLTDEDKKILADKAISQRAALDQEATEWRSDAEKFATFWTILRESGMGKELAGVMTINAQVRYYTDADDDEDGEL